MNVKMLCSLGKIVGNLNRGNGYPNYVEPRDFRDANERVVGSIRVKAPSFDSCLDPKAFVDWL